MNRIALGVLVAVGLLLYLRSPVDLLPDRMGAVGLLDDLAALGVGLWWFWKRFPRIPAGNRTSSGSAASGPSEARPSSDPYTVLGIQRGASREEIRQAYRERLREYHPDRVDDLGEELREVAHRRTIAIRRAYDELTKG